MLFYFNVVDIVFCHMLCNGFLGPSGKRCDVEILCICVFVSVCVCETCYLLKLSFILNCFYLLTGSFFQLRTLSQNACLKETTKV